MAPHHRTMKEMGPHIRTMKKMSPHCRTMKEMGPHIRTMKEMAPHYRTMAHHHHHRTVNNNKEIIIIQRKRNNHRYLKSMALWFSARTYTYHDYYTYVLYIVNCRISTVLVMILLYKNNHNKTILCQPRNANTTNIFGNDVMKATMSCEPIKLKRSSIYSLTRMQRTAGGPHLLLSQIINLQYVLPLWLLYSHSFSVSLSEIPLYMTLYITTFFGSFRLLVNVSVDSVSRVHTGRGPRLAS